MFNKFCYTFEIPLLSLSEYTINVRNKILIFMASIKYNVRNWIEYQQFCAYECKADL